MQNMPHDAEYEDGSCDYPAKLVAATATRSADIGELMTALAKAQGAIGDIERDRTVKVASQRGGYEFRYATLNSLIKGIKRPLSDNGISYTHVQTFDKNDRLYYLRTTLHYKNQFISSVVPLILSDQGGNQQYGSALTYMKRYTLAALVGVAPDEDDDGNIADGNEVQAMQHAINKTAPRAPAPDPIRPTQDKAPEIAVERVSGNGASGPSEAPVEDHGPNLHPAAFSSAKIDVTPLDDDHMDWLTWGKEFAAMARMALNAAQLDELTQNNGIPLKNMETAAPKMFGNMLTAVSKVRRKLHDAAT
jgi:hypothetical protein